MPEKPDNNKSHIGELQEKLYSKTETKEAQMRSHELLGKESNVPRDFIEPIEPTQPQRPPIFEEKKKGPGLTMWLLLASIVFFVGAISFASYSIFRGTGLVSPQNISVEISGPVSTPGGEKLSLDVSVINKNKAMLRTAELVIEYPPGTRKANGSSELSNERIFIGDLDPGQSARKNISAILYGEENTAADIKMSLEYRIPNSNSIFSKDVPYQITISSNPISLAISSPTETTSGDNLTISATITSNSNETIKNVLLSAQYPSGFTYKESSLRPVANNNTWDLGDLPAGQSRTIKIIGVLSGENEDFRTFRFQSGVASDDNPVAIQTPFAGFKNEIAIKKPFVGLAIGINDTGSKELSVATDVDANIDITYENNLSVPVRNVAIALLLSGTGLDETTVNVSHGFYQSNTNTVLWDKSGVLELGEVGPGERGFVSLTLKPKALPGATNPDVKLSATVSGERTDESGVPETISSAALGTIQLRTNATLSGVATHYTGPLKNTGPIPPKAEVETTYTITWSLQNSINDLGNSRVTATLPSYIRFVNEITPLSEKVTHNEVEHSVTWEVGTLRAGTGLTKLPRTVSFKIGFTPSLTQVGTSPTLVNSATLNAQDTFANTGITVTGDALTSRISESGIKTGDENVVQ